MEIDAATRYTETATLLRQQNELILAKIFDRLAETERGHVAEVSAWAEHRYNASTLDHPLFWPHPGHLRYAVGGDREPPGSGRKDDIEALAEYLAEV
jgi:rubrerythrin